MFVAERSSRWRSDKSVDFTGVGAPSKSARIAPQSGSTRMCDRKRTTAPVLAASAIGKFSRHVPEVVAMATGRSGGAGHNFDDDQNP